ARAEIRHARYDDAGALVLQHDVLVHQHAQPEPPDLGYPRAHARVIFVISGDEEGAVARRQARQAFGVPREFHDGAVDEIAGDGDHVSVKIVDRIDDGAEMAPLDRRADVDIADLGD